MAPPPSPRKSRKRIADSSHKNVPKHDAVVVDSQTGNQRPAFPLASFLWPARRSTSQWIILPLVLMAVGFLRWCVGLWGYSGFQIPPMYGDYEAQRHWMEITIHLPISHWYLYDLQYWGLDYPPLTAYHSWSLGKIGSLINPAWFALDASRGTEEQLLKVFMRATVIVSEYLIYVPAVIILNRKSASLYGVNKWESSIALVAILLQPATILIDHAHFQYNTVMLGLVLASIASILSEHLVWASFFFVGALCFKQMALYYAPSVFAFLLGSCILPRIKVLQLFAISITTLVSFGLMFVPMLVGALLDFQRGINAPLSLDERKVNPLMELLIPHINVNSHFYPIFLQLTQIIHRCFPFARGIFEDKVANVWCALHTIHKLNLYPTPLLQRISSMATLIAILPACMTISLHPRKELLPWAMASCAWGFFLCSFQVHEKSVLLPLLPMITLLSGEDGLGVEMRGWIGWSNILAVWTMFPLLKRDGLRIPYFVLTGLWAYLLSLPPASLNLYFGSRTPQSGLLWPAKALHLSFYIAMIIWHVFEALMPPPETKPDLWAVLNVLIGAVGFGIVYLWCSWQLIVRSGILEEYLGYRTDQDSKSKEERAKALPLPWPLGSKEVLHKPTLKTSQASPTKVGRPKNDAVKASGLDVGKEASPRKVGRPRKIP